MAELVNPPAAGRSFGETQRDDTWWVEIIPVVVLLGGVGIYATLRAFEGRFYEWGPYLSPFYSPLIDPNHHWWPFSPALLILGGPLGFRATCYYYRKAYYPCCSPGPVFFPSGSRTCMCASYPVAPFATRGCFERPIRNTRARRVDHRRGGRRLARGDRSVGPGGFSRRCV